MKVALLFLWAMTARAENCSVLISKMFASLEAQEILLKQRPHEVRAFLNERNFPALIKGLDKFLGKESAQKHLSLLTKDLTYSYQVFMQAYLLDFIDESKLALEKIDEILEVDPELYLLFHARKGNVLEALDKVEKNASSLEVIPSGDFFQEIFFESPLEQLPSLAVQWSGDLEFNPQWVKKLESRSRALYHQVFGPMQERLGLSFGDEVLLNDKLIDQGNFLGPGVYTGKILAFEKYGEESWVIIKTAQGDEVKRPVKGLVKKWSKAEEIPYLYDEESGRSFLILGKDLEKNYFVYDSTLEKGMMLDHKRRLHEIHSMPKVSLKNGTTLQAGSTVFSPRHNQEVEAYFVGRDVSGEFVVVGFYDENEELDFILDFSSSTDQWNL